MIHACRGQRVFFSLQRVDQLWGSPRLTSVGQQVHSFLSETGRRVQLTLQFSVMSNIKKKNDGPDILTEHYVTAVDFSKQELFRNNKQKCIPYLTLKIEHHNYADQPRNVVWRNVNPQFLYPLQSRDYIVFK